MKLPSAYLLVSHGSRDPRPEVEMQKLAQCVSERLYRRQRQPTRVGVQGVTTQKLEENRELPLVGTAQLELHPLPLHQQIAVFARKAIAVGCQRLEILPLFLLEGVHVMEDIPAEVATARKSLAQAIAIDLRPDLGSQIEGLSRVLATQIGNIKPRDRSDSVADSFASRQWILLAHGSRRPGSKHRVEQIAEKLNAVTAYWAIAPTLEQRVEEAIARGDRRLGIVPYFLFSGGITDAIAECATQLSQQQPDLDFHAIEPIGASEELADIILALIY